MGGIAANAMCGDAIDPTTRNRNKQVFLRCFISCQGMADLVEAGGALTVAGMAR